MAESIIQERKSVSLPRRFICFADKIREIAAQRGVRILIDVEEVEVPPAPIVLSFYGNSDLVATMTEMIQDLQGQETRNAA
jgi:hypothetical protein